MRPMSLHQPRSVIVHNHPSPIDLAEHEREIPADWLALPVELPLADSPARPPAGKLRIERRVDEEAALLLVQPHSGRHLDVNSP